MDKKSPKTFLGLRSTAIVEIFLFFVICTIVSFPLEQKWNFFDTAPHPYWIIVLAMSFRYGAYEGLVSSFIATGILLLGPLPVRSPLEDPFVYTFTLLKNPILWFIVAVILGEARSKQKRKLKKFQEEISQAEEKEERMARSYTDLKKIKEKLEIRVSSEMHTVISAIEAFKKLEIRDEKSLFEGSAELIKVLIDPEKFSLFLLKEDTLVCQLTRGWEENEHFATSFTKESNLFKEVIEKQNTPSILVHKNTYFEGEGVLATPLICPYTKKSIGMLKIEQIPFAKLKMVKGHTAELLGQWIGAAYVNLTRKSAT